MTTGPNGCAGVRASSSGNTIGGTTPADRNSISATSGCGIDVVVAGSSNVVQGNYIGTNASGTVAHGGTIGVDVTGTSHTVGGTASGAGNLISGHGGDGVRIRAGTSGNLIQGNFIGTNAAGTAAMINFAAGISITDSPNNSIGGTAAGAGNVISGNTTGLTITGAASTGNSVAGNLIGLSAAGTAPIPNVAFGVRIVSAPNNSIGSVLAGARNVISGNGGSAISLFHADQTQILGNFIGTDPSGTAPIPNNGAVFDDGSVGILVGAAALGGGNVISGNFGDAVALSGSNNATIQGNNAGTNAAGTGPLPNTGSGVVLVNTSGATIGGSAAGEGNLLSGNQNNGILISGGSAPSIRGNWIGIDRAGTGAIPNAGSGVFAAGPAMVGDGTAAGGNLIAVNSRQGVRVLTTQNVTIRGNRIFDNGSPFYLNSELGIDLEDDGPTPNDPGDGDTGANGLQNFPVIRSTTVDSSNTTVVGSFNSMPSTGYTLDFYSNPACGLLGYGQGRTFLGSAMVTTDASGNANFNLSFPTVNLSETVITATATDPNGNTSEFSACAIVAARFYAVTPCRVVDTRRAAGPYGGPSLQAGADRAFVFGGQCGIPATAAAVAVNVVAMNPTTGPGFLTLFPGGTARPHTATINYNAGKIRANNAVIPLGTLNDIMVHCGQGNGTADMVIDVNGYFQ